MNVMNARTQQTVVQKQELHCVKKRLLVANFTFFLLFKSFFFFFFSLTICILKTSFFFVRNHSQGPEARRVRTTLTAAETLRTEDSHCLRPGNLPVEHGL